MVEKLEGMFEGIGEVRGFVYERVFEDATWYIYRVTAGSHVYYEVFRRRRVALCLDFENRVYSDSDFKEVYPKANDFGIWAWTFGDIDKAMSYIKNK